GGGGGRGRRRWGMASAPWSRRSTSPVEQATGVTGQPAAVELRGVTRSFGGRPVLKALDLVIPRGQVVALLGPSGAGKTTLLRVLTGLLPPDAGLVRVLGQDLASLPSSQRRRVRRHIRLLYQHDAPVPRPR